MRRYWIEHSDIAQDLVSFKDETFHHIFDVCRQNVGSKFEVLTEKAEAHFVEVIEVQKKKALARILETREIPPLKDPKIHLVMSVPRFPVFESVLEKAVEMGVQSIHLFFSDFSFVKTHSSISESKYERWDKIIRSATQQTGRGDLLKLYKPVTFSKLNEVINPSAASWGLFAYEGETVKSLKEEISLKKQANISPKDIWLIIGAEGGFSFAEVDEFKKLGLDPVTLGSQVLRVETACMTLVSVLKYDFDLMC